MAGTPRWHTPTGHNTMTTIGRVRLDNLQKEYGERLLSVLTVLLLIMLFVVAPFHAAGIKLFEPFGAVVALVMVAGVRVISASPTATLVMLAGFLLNVLVVIARLIRPSTYDLYFLATAWLVIACTLVVGVARIVFAPGRASVHRLIVALRVTLL